MKANDSFPKPEFKVPDGYFKSLESELLKIPTENPRKASKPRVFWIRTISAVAAILALALFIPWESTDKNTITDLEIAAYLESEGAWMLDDLAFDVELAATSFNSSDDLDEWNDLLFIEGVEDDFWYDESM